MSANGRIVTGYSKPYVAIYSATDGVVSYSNGQILARGVSVSISPETEDEEFFYADNVAAESTGTAFTGGTATLGVDGLLQEAEDLIYGLDGADDDGWTHFGKAAEAPYVGIGFIVRYMSDGTTTYQPTILRKAKFIQNDDEAETQEDTISFQDQELEANLYRDDTDLEDWKWRGLEFETEDEAEEAIKTVFNIADTTEE